MKKEELEIMRHNVTPAQFAAYVRQQIKKHNLTTICAGDIDLEYWKKGGDLEFDIRHDDSEKETAPCKAESSISKPYEMQTYIRQWDGTCYNEIMEFSFDDEKTGTGYFYFICTWNEEEAAEAPAETESSMEEAESSKREAEASQAETENYKAVAPKKAKEICEKLGLETWTDDGGKTFFCTNKAETEVYIFDSEKERRDFLKRKNAG